MQLIIEQSDFQRLSPEVQRQLMAVLSGAAGLAYQPTPPTAGLRWRRPVDLTHDQAVKLVHGLPEDHRRRLELFARKDGRVRMKDIMAVAGDHDLSGASEFQKAMTRRLRRLIDDPEKKAQLIGWDFDATKWDARQTTIVDGVYFVTPATAEVLRAVLKPRAARRRAG